MIREVDLVSYLPEFMQSYTEPVAALEGENPEFDIMWKAVDRVLCNRFIATADEYGISRFEKMLGIHPANEDTLESRRSRVHSKWFNRIPYTWKTLLQKLIVLCSDTDVFDFSQKPPIRWDEIKKELLDNGALKIIHVQAKRSIEDWFLYDVEGILRFLRLSKTTKVSGKSGYDKLQCLYKQAQKVYFKGIQSNGMIGRLDIEKIANAVKDQLNPLYEALGVDKN